MRHHSPFKKTRLFFFRAIILPIFRQNEAAIDKVVMEGKEKLSELTEKTTSALIAEDKKST
jgi:hypothetical protein